MSPAWISRLVGRLRDAQGEPTEVGERAVLEVLRRRGSFADEASFLAALAGQLAGRPVAEATVECIASHLRGRAGEELDRLGPHLGAHLDFWSELARAGGSPLARACRADLLLRTGRREDALGEFLDAFELDPALAHFQSELHDLLRAETGEARLRYRLACLRAALVGERPGDPGEGGDDGDEIRESYGDLLEEHRGDPDALARIRELGALIEEAVDRGDLPRAIVRRAPRG
jgi:hypothetical protein